VSARRVALALALALGAGGCRKARPTDQLGTGELASAPPDQEPPVALNGDSPIQYPPRLYDQKVEGDVVLRLFVDSTGRLAPESSGVAEPSGYPALDSAALSGVRRLRFAPARRHGLPIATAFLQPVEFRHPQAGASALRGEPDTARPGPGARAPAPAPTPPSAAVPGLSRTRRRRAARPDTLTVPQDTTRPTPDTARVAPDSGRPRPNANARPH
jgi:TonB family protein